MPTGNGFADLTNLRTVVTGSSSGIGRAIAWEFARGGAHVLIHCRRSVEQAESLAAAIQQMGRSASVITADFADRDALAGFVEKAWNTLGEVDVWVNNAGVDLLTGSAGKTGYEHKLEQLCQVDIRSTVLLSRFVGRRMRDAGKGTILNIGWDQAQRGMEGESGELFAVSKNAVMGFTRSLALSLAPTVRVNCIAPGWIRTAWGRRASEAWQQRVLRETPLRRWGEPEDVAALARFLASGEAAYITGQVINVNGGAVR